MKIGINLIPFTSVQGTEVYTKNILSNVLEIEKDDEFYIFKSESSPSFFKFNNGSSIKEIVVKGISKKYFKAFYQQFNFYALLKRLNINLLFCPSPAAPVFYKNKIVVIHDCAYNRFSEFDNLLSKIYYRMMFYGARCFSKKIVTVSNFSKQEIMNLYKVPSHKIEVIYEAVPELPEIEDNFVQEALRKFEITAPYFLYIGNWRPRKNLPGLIEAFKLFKKDTRLDYLLVIAGRIDKRFLGLEKEIKKNQLDDKVILIDFILREEVAALYKRAKALCFPSLYEGFGLPVLEAQSMGIPILTSNISSLPEVAGGAALYVNPYDIKDIAQGMKRLAEDDTLCQELIKKGVENIKRFSWPKSAQQLLDIFHSA